MNRRYRIRQIKKGEEEGKEEGKEEFLKIIRPEAIKDRLKKGNRKILP